MIDSMNEELVSLAEAARLLPRRRGGKKAHTSSIYRWTTSGCRGVILESIQIGGTRCTSKQALARFFQRLTAGDAADVPKVRSCAQRQRAADQAIAFLQNEGI